MSTVDSESAEELGVVDPSSQIPLLSYPSRGESPLLFGPNIAGSVSYDNLLSVENFATPSQAPSEVFASSREDISSGKAALYAALPLHTPTSIRVLDLVESEDGLVTGQLRVVDLHEHPLFTALSYVWGDYSEPKDTISCNGHLVEVTKNCHSALRRLRGFGPLTIWVDSICINQDDAHEQGVQIPLMGTLYSSTGAQAVYVWLGKGTKDTDGAMDYLGKGGLPFTWLISKYLRDDQTWEGGIPTGSSMALRLAFHLYFRTITLRLWPHYNGLQDLLGRPWVERLWTLQEALLSDKVVIVCGMKTISLQALVYSVLYMEVFSLHKIGIRFPRELARWQRLVVIWRVLFAEHVVNTDHRRALYDEMVLHQKYLERGWLFFKILIYLQLALLFIFEPVYIVLWYTVVRPEDQFKFLIFGLVYGLILPSSFFVAILISTIRFRFYTYTFAEAMFIEIYGRKSLRPKDKFYATYSLLGSLSSAPDYSTSSLKLAYQRLFENLLRRTQSLDILLFTSHSKVRKSPSWVINWSSTRPSWIEAKFYLGTVINHWTWRYRNLFSRTSITTMHRYLGATFGSQKPYFVYKGLYVTSQDPKTLQGRLLIFLLPSLQVTGITIGRISWSSGRIRSISDTTSEEELLDSMKAFLEVFNRVKDVPYSESPDDSTSSKIDKLSRLAAERQDYHGLRNIRYRWRMTMISGIRKGPEWTLKQFQRVHKWSFLWMWGTRVRRWVDEASKLLPKRVRTPFDFHRDLANYFNSEHMAFGICEGPYSEAGIVPSSTKEGDVVALISGVSMPMILREFQAGNYTMYEVIGPSFFRGAMDGRVWYRLSSGTLDEIWLI